MTKDYYKVLSLPRNASDEQIKKAYRKLAMQYHPDRNAGKEKWANERFKEINEAYTVLGDPQKRKQYDRFGTVGGAGDIFSSPFTSTIFQDIVKDFGSAGLRFDFLDDIFGDLLKGRGFSFSSRGSGRPTKMRSESRQGRGTNPNEIFGQARRAALQDVRYELIITRKEAIQGARKILTRKGRRLEVNIPAGVGTGSMVKLINARQATDGIPGNILIKVVVK